MPLHHAPCRSGYRFVAGDDEEAGAVAADALVLVQLESQDLPALRLAALAEERHLLLELELARPLLDPLVAIRSSERSFTPPVLADGVETSNRVVY
jgi:hypothetical protein